MAVSYTHLDVYKRQGQIWNNGNVIAEYGTKGTKTYIRGAGGEIVKTKDSANNNLSLIHIWL